MMIPPVQDAADIQKQRRDQDRSFQLASVGVCSRAPTRVSTRTCAMGPSSVEAIR
jgi:hypothetical protein